MRNKKTKSQIKTDKNILNFLRDLKVKNLEDLITLRKYILDNLEFKPYNKKTKKHADSIQWKRTALMLLEMDMSMKVKLVQI